MEVHGLIDVVMAGDGGACGIAAPCCYATGSAKDGGGESCEDIGGFMSFYIDTGNSSQWLLHELEIWAYTSHHEPGYGSRTQVR